MTLNTLVDFHMHTKSEGSDGFMEPRDFVDYLSAYAKFLGVPPRSTYFALTDHNTTAGLEQTAELFEGRGIKFIPGCEVMVYEPAFDLNLEILLYGSIGSLEDSMLQEVLNNNRQGLSERITSQLEKWRREGLRLEGKKFSLSNREYALLDSQKQRQNDFAFFGKIFMEKVEAMMGRKPSAPEVNHHFYNAFRNPGEGSLYAPYDREKFANSPRLFYVADKLGLISSLAHPGEYHIAEADRDRLVQDLTSRGLKGIEVYIRKNTDEQIKKYLKLVKKKGLVATGGSDFHGIFRDYTPGAYRYSDTLTEYIPESVARRLMGEVMFRDMCRNGRRNNEIPEDIL
jgi:3',5'-nucleoside bisphosphate phosphatase